MHKRYPPQQIIPWGELLPTPVIVFPDPRNYFLGGDFLRVQGTSEFLFPHFAPDSVTMFAIFHVGQ